jgi:hypothetical protein
VAGLIRLFLREEAECLIDLGFMELGCRGVFLGGKSLHRGISRIIHGVFSAMTRKKIRKEKRN